MADPTQSQATDTPAKAPLQQEVASISRDPQLIRYNNTLRHDDDTLLTRGNVKSYKIYDELERDAHCGAVLDKRKMAVTSRPWCINAASDAAQDVATAEMVRNILEAMPFDQLCEDLLDATLKGFAVAEVMWAVRDGLVVPDRIKPRQQRRFVFNLQDELRLKTREALIEGVELPERKFIVHTFGGKDGSRYGLGLGSKLFWPVWFKKQGITFWLTFADKFGSPTTVGKYPNGANQEEQKKLLQALAAIAQDAGVIVPEGMEIDLLEATRSGTVDTYEKLCRYMDEQISKAVLGETMSTTAASAGLGSNQAGVQNDVRKEVAERDARMVCQTLQQTLVQWLVDFNAPGRAAPKLERDFDEPEDLTARAERDSKINTMGFEPTEQYILDTYGEGWVKKATPAPLAAPNMPGLGTDPNAMPGGDPAAQFAESPVAHGRQFNHAAQDAILQAADSLAATWNTTMRKRVEDLQAVAEETHDFAMFRERLAHVLDSPPPKELVESIARATFAAHLVGRGQAKGHAAAFAEATTAADRSLVKGFFSRLFNRP